MKIERVRVEGFGHFERLELPLGPGLNLLHGPNEAGKSTLLAFIRAVLFGFEKRSSPARYEPVRGAFGGELHLSTRLGPLVARRVPGRRFEGELVVRSGDGAPLPESRLSDALAGVPKELYYEVFAFGLDELSSFEALAAQGSVSEALFTAGMQGAHRLPAALETLRRGTEALWVPRGQKPELNDVLNQLGSVRDNLKAVGDRPAEYLGLSARLSGVEGALQRAEAAAEAAERALREARRLERAAPELALLGEVEAALSELPELSAFPRGAHARWEELTARLTRARAERDALWAERAGVEAALTRVSEPLPIEAQALAARAAVEAYRGRVERLRALPARAAALEARRRQVGEALEGLGLSQAELSGLDFGVASRSGLASRKEALGEAARVLRDREEALRAAEAEHGRAQAALRRAEAELARLPVLPAEALERRRTAALRVEPLRAELVRLEGTRRDRRASAESYRAQVEAAPEEAFPLWLAGAVCGGLLLLALAVLLALDARLGTWALGAAALLSGLVFGVQRRAARGHAAQAAAYAAREAFRAGEVARLSAELAGLEAEGRVRQAALAAALREAEVDPDADGAHLAALVHGLGTALGQAQARERLEAEAVALRAESDAHGVAVDRARAGRDEAAEGREALAEELSAWLRERRLPADLSAERALELWTEVANARQRLLDVEADGRALEVDSEDCARAAGAVVALAQAALGQALEPEAAASALAAALEQVEARSRERLGLEEKRAALEAQGTRAAVALEEDLEAARRLLAQAGCEDGEALARREAEAARFAELSQRARELRLKVETAALCGVADARARLLEAGGAEALGARRARLEAEVQRLSAERQALAEERGGIRARLDELERDLSVAGYRAAEERLVAQAGGLSHRYAVDRLALSLLRYAKQLHEQQHQPRLVQLASRAFEALTAGRYTRVLAQVGEERALRVRDADGTEWSPEQLSRGTREQLYLAFRLAVIQDFGEVRAPLPVIVDDILVNFDPERTRNTVKALAELARSHQVLAFTCHPYLAVMFEEEGARLTELPASPRARARAKTA